MDVIRLIFAAIFLVAGITVFVIATFGVFKFRYVANRMHAAALGDTLGLLLSYVGIAIYYGFTFDTLKIVLIIAFLWLASPVSSHLISGMIVETDPDFEKECEVK